VLRDGQLWHAHVSAAVNVFSFPFSFFFCRSSLLPGYFLLAPTPFQTLQDEPYLPGVLPNAPNQVTVAPGSDSPVLKWGTTFWWNTWTPANSSANPCAKHHQPLRGWDLRRGGGIARYTRLPPWGSP